VTQYGIIPDRKAFLKAQRRNKAITYEDFEALRDNMQMAARVGLETRRTGLLRVGTESMEDVDVAQVSLQHRRNGCGRAGIPGVTSLILTTVTAPKWLLSARTW